MNLWIRSKFLKNIEKITMLFGIQIKVYQEFAYSLSMIYNCFFNFKVWRCKEFWRDFGKISKTSKMILISKSKITDKDCIEQLMRNFNAKYLNVVKSNKTFNSKFSNSNRFDMDSDELNELFSNYEF